MWRYASSVGIAIQCGDMPLVLSCTVQLLLAVSLLCCECIDNRSVLLEYEGDLHQSSGYNGSSMPLGATVDSPWARFSCTGDADLDLCLPCSEGACKCGSIPNSVVRCTDGQMSVLDCTCVTYNNKSDLLEIGSCIYNCELINNDLSDKVYHPLPENVNDLDETMCGKIFNRSGTLCGSCKEGFYSLVDSFDMTCVKCPQGKSNWWKFVLAVFVPVTIFYFVVLFLRVNITSSHLHGFVFYCQLITIPGFVRVIYLKSRYSQSLQMAVHFYASIYGIWNLDFFRSTELGICLGTDTLVSLALELSVGMYILMLMLLSYLMIDLHSRNFKPIVVLWKPFKTVLSLFHDNWDIRTSLVDAFATFFLLSNVKFLSISFDLLYPVRIYQLSLSSGNLSYSWRFFYDANVIYFGEQHLPYAISAIVLLVLFTVLPTIILGIYPFSLFQKILRIFPFRWHALHTFVDAVQGYYKDGTEPGTRDCRWFASVFYILRLMIFLTGLFMPNSMFFVAISMTIVIVFILLITIQPFKDRVRYYHEANAVLILICAFFCVCLVGEDMASIHRHKVILPFLYFEVITITISFVYMSVVIVYSVYKRRRFGFQLIRRVHAWRNGYNFL